MSGAWTVERHDGVAVLAYGLDAPQPMPIAAMAELARHVGELAGEAEPPVLVLAVGIRHADLQEVLELTEGRPIRDFAPWVAAIAAVEAYPLPVVAAIPQRATAGGCELVLAADLRVAAPAARLGVFETRLGIIPGAGGTQRLPRLVGPGHAARLVYGGDFVEGAEAARLGLVEALADDPVAEATRIARDFADRGTEVLAAAKQALRAAADRPLADGLRVEGRAFLSLLASSGASERTRAWLARGDAS